MSTQLTQGSNVDWKFFSEITHSFVWECLVSRLSADELCKKADKQRDLFVVWAWAQSSASSRKPICVSCEATLAISMVWRIWRMTGSSDFNHKASGKVLNVHPRINTNRLRLWKCEIASVVLAVYSELDIHKQHSWDVLFLGIKRLSRI